jgi:hypothetical protein
VRSALRRCRRSLPHRCHRQHLCGARRPGGHGSITRATFSAELIRSSLTETTHDGPRRIVASVNVDERITDHPRGRGRPDARSVRLARSDRRQGGRKYARAMPRDGVLWCGFPPHHGVPSRGCRGHDGSGIIANHLRRSGHSKEWCRDATPNNVASTAMPSCQSICQSFAHTLPDIGRYEPTLAGRIASISPAQTVRNEI